MAERKRNSENFAENISPGIFIVDGGISEENTRLAYNIFLDWGVEVPPMVLRSENALDYILAFIQASSDEPGAQSLDINRFSIVHLVSNRRVNDDQFSQLLLDLKNKEIDLSVYKLANPEDQEALNQLQGKIFQRFPRRLNPSTPLPTRLTHTSQLLYSLAEHRRV